VEGERAPELAARTAGSQFPAPPGPGVPLAPGLGYVMRMTRRLSFGWASLVAWMLLGLVPVSTPALGGPAERALRPAERGQSPLGNNPTPPTDPRFSIQSPRQGWPLDTALPADPFALAVRFLVVAGPLAGTTRPAPLAPVAFPHFPTGPPVSS